MNRISSIPFWVRFEISLPFIFRASFDPDFGGIRGANFSASDFCSSFPPPPQKRTQTCDERKTQTYFTQTLICTAFHPYNTSLEIFFQSFQKFKVKANRNKIETEEELPNKSGKIATSHLGENEWPKEPQFKTGRSRS